MPSYEENSEYFKRMYPYAQKASAKIKNIIPASTILSQWAHETGFGTSPVSKNANNHGGIKFVSGISISSGSYGAYAKYATLDQFVDDYVRVMNLSYYTKIRDASSPEDTIRAFAGTPYAEDPDYASKVLGIFNTYGVRGYDTYKGGGGDVSAPSSPELSGDDMKKYAAIGLAFVALLALAK